MNARLRPYRTLLLAVAASAAVHAAFVAGIPAPTVADPAGASKYIATLVPAPRDPDDLPGPKDPPAPPKPLPEVAHHHVAPTRIATHAAPVQPALKPAAEVEPLL